MFSATDWMLKRVLKSVLKKTVGRYLQSEPDLDQLDVQLSKGTFELRNVLLNCDAVNAQLALDGWSITACYIGLVKGAIPLTATGSSTSTAARGANAAAADAAAAAANFTVDEVLVTVTPCPTGPGSSNTNHPAAARNPAAAAGPEQQQQQQQQPGLVEDLRMLGQAGVLDGIKLIAGGLESVLQRLSVAATNVTIRLEVPAAAAARGAAGPAVGAEVVVRLDSAHFCDATPQQQQQQQGGQEAAAAFTDLVKCISVTGLMVELLDLTDDQLQDEQSKFMATSQLLSSSTLAGQQQGWGDSSTTAAAAAAVRSSFMSRSSYMTSSMRASLLDEGSLGEAAAAAQDLGGQQCYDGLLLFGPSCQQGLDVKVELRLSQPAAAAAAAANHTGISNSSTNAPRMTVDISSSAVNVALQPWQLPLVDLIKSAAAAASSNTASSSSSPQHASQLRQQSGQQQQQQQWGHRSFVEDIFFPQCEGLVAESLGASGVLAPRAGWGLAGSDLSLNPSVQFYGSGLMGSAGSGLYSSGITGQQNDSHYHSQYDTNNAVNDNLYHSGSSGVTDVSGGLYSMYQDARSMFSGGSSSSSPTLRRQQQQRRIAAAAATAWSIRACVPAVTVSLYYHVPSCEAAAAAARLQQQQQQSHPRSDQYIIANNLSSHSPGLIVQCNGLVTSVDLADRSCHITVKCYNLEITEQLSVSWTSLDRQLQGLSPRDVGAVPRLIPAVPGTTGFVQQAPSYTPATATSGSSSSSSSSTMQKWPVLLVGGSPLEPGRGLPAVQRPSVTIKTSQHYKDANRSKLTKAAVDCELLPVTVVYTSGLMQRISCIAAQQQQQQQQQQPAHDGSSSRKQRVQAVIGQIIDGLSQEPAAAAVRAGSCVTPDQPAGAADLQQQQQQGVLPPSLIGADVSIAVHVVQICAVLPLVPPSAVQLAAAAPVDPGHSAVTGRFIALDLHAGSSSSRGHQQQHSHHSSTRHLRHHHQQQRQQPGVHEAAAGSSTVLPLIRVTSSPAAAAAGSEQQQQQQQGMQIEGFLTRLRVFYVTAMPRQHSSSSSSSSGLAAAAAKVAAAAAKVGSSSSSSKLQQQQQQQHGYSLNRLLRRQQQQPSAGSSSSSNRAGSSSSMKLAATCVVDACPAAAAATVVGFKHTAHQEGSVSGPDSVPLGSAVYVTVILDSMAKPAANAVAAAAAVAAAHARDRVADGEVDHWGNAWTAAAAESRPADLAKNNSRINTVSDNVSDNMSNNSYQGVLGFQQLCQQGSRVVIHVRAPAVTGFVSQSDLIGLVRAAAAAGSAAAAAVSQDTRAKQQQQQQHDQQQQQQQVTILMQCRLQCCLQSTDPSKPQQQQQQHKHSKRHAETATAAASKDHGSSNTRQNLGQTLVDSDRSSFEISADEISLFHVQALGGAAAATASCLCIQGLQLLTSQSGSNVQVTSGQSGAKPGQLCALLLPKHSKTVGPPGLEVLVVSPGSSGSSSSSSGITSIVLRGTTLSTDPGGLSMDWMNQISTFVSPISAAAAGPPPNPTAASSSSSKLQQQQQQLVVNLQDFAIRCEPRSDTPTSHNSSRMAAAFLLEGAHWTLNPKPHAPQHIVLHSLGFYVAAAAARSSLTPSGLSAGMLLLNPRGSSVGLLNPSGGSGSSGLGCWDPAAPVDLHGFSVSGAGYNCLAQEGGLAVTLRPAAQPADAAAAAGVGGRVAASPGTLEIEVTNSHLTGSLRKDTAALAVQLMNQWSAHTILRNATRHVSSSSSSVDTPEYPCTAPAAAAPAQQQQQQQGLLSDIQENAFRVAKRTDSRSSSRSGNSNNLMRAASSVSSVNSIPPLGSAVTAATRRQQQQQQLDSSVYVSGGWYPTPNNTAATTAAPSEAGDEQQQQQELIPVVAAAENAVNDVAAAEAVAALQEQQQQELGTESCTVMHDWGLDQPQQQQQEQQQQERRGLLSLLEPECLPLTAAAAPNKGWDHDLDAFATAAAGSPLNIGDLWHDDRTTEITADHTSDHGPDQTDDVQCFLSEGLLAASILAQLPAAAAAAGEVPDPVPVVLDDFFVDPETLKATTSVTNSDLGFSAFSDLDDVMLSNDDGYDIISPRSAAEAAAAARARRAAAAGFSGSSVAEEPAAAGIWYINDHTSDAAADLSSSGFSSRSHLAAAQAAGGSNRSSLDLTTTNRDSAALAAAAQPVPIKFQDDYVAPGSTSPDQSGSPTAAAAAASNSDGVPSQGARSTAQSYPAGFTPTKGVSSTLHPKQKSPGKGFVSPWSRVLSHPLFQHLLPLDPSAPRPVTKIVFKGLSGMFVLHDRGAVLAPPAGGLHSRRVAAAAAGSSGGRLEVEVDGVALQMEIYPAGHCHVSRMTVALGSIEIRDCRRTAATAAAGSRTGSSVAAAAAATAAAARAAATAAAAAAAAGHGPRRVAAAAAAGATARGSGSSSSAQSGSGAAGSSSGKWCRVLSVRRPGTKGGARISRGSSSSTHPVRAATVASSSGPKSPEQQQQQHQSPLLGGMLQGWPAAVLAPDTLLPAAAVVLETVKPDPNAADDAVEYRLGVALLPMKLKLKQELVAFLAAFAAAVNDAVAAVENPLVAAMAAAAAVAAAAAAEQQRSGSEVVDLDQEGDLAAGSTPVTVQMPFFQKVVIWGTGVSVDYCPRRVDIIALRDGDFLELLNLVPWGGVDLTLQPLRFTGLVGWEGLVAAAAAEWLQYVAKTQAHKFLTGVAPIRSVIKVTGAVAALLSGPAAVVQDAIGSALTAATRTVTDLASTGSSSDSSSTQQVQQRLRQLAAAVATASRAAAAANRQQGSSSSANSLQIVLRSNTAGFARVLLYEALGLGAGVAAGAEVVLAGGRPVLLPAGVPAGLVEGLRAAANEVQGGLAAAAEVLAQGFNDAGFNRGGYNQLGFGGNKPLSEVATAFMRVAPAAAAAPARGLAAAARTALLGAQNALGATGPQQQQQQQQQQEQEVDDPMLQMLELPVAIDEIDELMR